jgi:hypothetical protein
MKPADGLRVCQLMLTARVACAMKTRVFTAGRVYR